MLRTLFVPGRLGAIAGALVLVAAAGLAPGGARAAEKASAACPARFAYSLAAGALTGKTSTDLTLRFTEAAGCDAVTTVRSLVVTLPSTGGRIPLVASLQDVAAPGGVVQLPVGRIAQGTRINVLAAVQTGTPLRTNSVNASTPSLLRPDLVVSRVTAPLQTLPTHPVDVTAEISEVNGDVGATATVTLTGNGAPLAGPQQVTVPAGGHVTLTFPGIALTTPVPVVLDAAVTNVAPDEYDATNNERSATVEVTKNRLASPPRVLFPSLGGYGAQFNGHLYAPVTPWPPNLGYGDVENKVKMLEPQLVRIFYNDNWDGNANGNFPDWQKNYTSFVSVVQLAQDTGATIMIGFQNLGNVLTGPAGPPMAKFADVLQDLVVNHGLTNVRWVEVGNEPNSGSVSIPQYEALVRAMNTELVNRGLRDQIHIMGPGLVENGGNPARDHYAFLQTIATDLGGILDAYAEHVYWFYYDSGRLEYRLRDSWHLADEVLPPEQRKPLYMMEFGIRANDTCGTKPAFRYLYYAVDPSCPEIWRTNIAGFQQFWFNVDSAQLGVAGTSKWDAYWGRYDNSSATNQLHWMIGPPTEGSPLTPTYYAMSLIFHTTAPGWQIIGVDPWDSSDWSVPAWRTNMGDTTNDQPEQELAAYTSPTGDVTVLGLDTNGKALNTVSAGPPSSYSIGNLPPDTTFTLAVWNASGDGTNSIAGTVTTNDAGVARFDVPLQAAFALTTVPVS